VVLDEMNTGHSIYKLNIDDLDGGDEEAVAGRHNKTGRAPHLAASPPCRLPDPVLRLGYSSVGSCAHFEALGSNIIVTGRTRHNRGGATFVYDTRTARLDVEQPPPEDFIYWYYHAAAAGNKLYTFSSGIQPPHYLCEQRALREYSGYDSGEERMRYGMRGQINEWAWGKSPSPLPGSRYNDGNHVQSYAVHPDGRTIFVSCGNRNQFTYSLDTENGESTHHGHWGLPFDGRAYYYAHLDAWVGIRDSNSTDGGKETSPYLYSCDIPNNFANGKQPFSVPEWRMCKDELTFVEDVASRALVHTGRGRFCLVETTSLPVDEGAEDNQCTCSTGEDVDQYLLHVTMFCAKHDKNGDLVVSQCRRGRSYIASNYASESLRAFWL
jgi:hypothetical protein